MKQDCKNSLLEVIELQIIPRLVDSHPAPLSPQLPVSGATYAPGDAEVQAFAKLCLLDTDRAANQFVELLLRDGYSVQDIYMQLIASTARYLGWQWEQDETDFSQVTLGLMRLQQLTHRLGYEYHSGPQSIGQVRRLMMASAPGSQHLLGLSMVSEFFRKDGWQVVVEIADNQAGLLQTVKNEWFDLLGLSVGLCEQIALLPELIAQLKAASRNPAVPIILGGAAFTGSTVRWQDLGADGISTDAVQAVELGASLVQPK
jgi:methanogenic corrinoid protein MtbC1